MSETDSRTTTLDQILADELSPDAELADKTFVSIEVSRVEIVEQAPALTDEPEEAAARMMIFRVRFKMLGQLFYARRKERNLDFRRTAIVSGSRVVGDDCSLASGLKGHQDFYSFPFRLFGRKFNSQDNPSKGRLLIMSTQRLQILAIRASLLWHAPGWIRRRRLSAADFDPFAYSHFIIRMSGYVDAHVAVAAASRVRCQESDGILLA